MATGKAGSTTLAADESLGSITICACDVVSLHLGAFSLRMEKQAFARLYELVTAAARELKERAVLTNTLENSRLNSTVPN